MSDCECGNCYHWKFSFLNEERLAEGYCPWTDEVIHEDTPACERHMRGEQVGFVMREASHE